MANLYKEETIMSSNDGSITLTTHRILQRTEKVNKELMLTDFLSYERINKKVRYFKTLSIIFLTTTVLFGVSAYVKDQQNQQLHARINDAFSQLREHSVTNNEQQQALMGIFVFSLILLCISVLLFLISSQKYIKIAGKFSSIEFSIKNLSSGSLNKFLTALVVESDNRKKE